MKERLQIIDGEGDPDRWFAPRTIPFAECAGDAEFLCIAESGVVLAKNSIGVIFRHDSIEDKLSEVIEEYANE